MKKNACLIVGFFAFLCFSGQSPRKETVEVTTNQPLVEVYKVEVREESKEEPRKSAAQRAREDTGVAKGEPVSAAKKAVQAEQETYY